MNFFAPIMLARGLVDELEAAKGSVVNVTSIAGSRVHPFAGSAYATSKAALASLTREMAADFGPRGIRVNAIAPGEIDTADPVARHRKNRRDRSRCGGSAHRRSRKDHLRALHRDLVLRERRRNPHQWRPARLGRPATSRATLVDTPARHRRACPGDPVIRARPCHTIGVAGTSPAMTLSYNSHQVRQAGCIPFAWIATAACGDVRQQ